MSVDKIKQQLKDESTPDREWILEANFRKIKSQVAEKYGLGSTLVMGHREKYWNEAAHELAKYAFNHALDLAAENARTKTERMPNINVWGDYITTVDKESILNIKI